MTAASFGPRLNPQGGVTFREGIGEHLVGGCLPVWCGPEKGHWEGL
jgi:hypothetical protein